jgi:hypothetical protein
MKKLFVLSSVISLFFANLMFSSKKENNFLSVKNIEMLQVSAAEAECKNTSNNPCRIHIPDGTILNGIGQPWISY